MKPKYTDLDFILHFCTRETLSRIYGEICDAANDDTTNYEQKAQLREISDITLAKLERDWENPDRQPPTN